MGQSCSSPRYAKSFCTVNSAWKYVAFLLVDDRRWGGQIRAATIEFRDRFSRG